MPLTGPHQPPRPAARHRRAGVGRASRAGSPIAGSARCNTHTEPRPDCRSSSGPLLRQRHLPQQQQRTKRRRQRGIRPGTSNRQSEHASTSYPALALDTPHKHRRPARTADRMDANRSSGRRMFPNPLLEAPMVIPPAEPELSPRAPRLARSQPVELAKTERFTAKSLRRSHILILCQSSPHTQAVAVTVGRSVAVDPQRAHERVSGAVASWPAGPGACRRWFPGPGCGPRSRSAEPGRLASPRRPVPAGRLAQS